ncbi:MAG TPA: histidinol dehydrogenase [Longimicrobiaceae bacterium]|nr:histidinol dehydrogenase [Longimicrobiaceae bacterium]
MRASAPFTEIRGILRAETAIDPGVREATAEIVRAVAERGDAAVLEYTARFDGVSVASLSELSVGREEMERASEQIDPDLLAALQRAAANIRAFHEKQLDHGFLDLLLDGSILGQRVLPLARVGVYVPGGRAAYPSSVLMNSVPARVAGVERIAVVCPAPGGEIQPAVLAAAHIAGVDELFRIGGAQAVAALAYGTATIAAVDKIVGPGNRWVTEAKRQVFGMVDIDMIAGPSEILVIADETANPRHVAADLIGQAEHDPDAIAWLVTDQPDLPAAVLAEIDELLSRNPRRDIATESLQRNGLFAIVADLGAAADVANLRSAEHVELLVRDPVGLAGRVRNAGALFLGHNTAEPLGDYFAGPNHVLPTGGTARWASPLGTYEFLKRTSIIGYSRERLLSHADDVIRLAEAEHLPGHAEAIRVRLPDESADRRGSR